jgi:hypothetical protein
MLLAVGILRHARSMVYVGQRKLTRKFIRCLKLGSQQRNLLLEALLLLGVARVVIIALPFKIYSRWLGAPSAAADGDERAEAVPAMVRSVRLAIAVAARNTPWESACLVQAMAARWMLVRRGVPTSLHLGVRHEPSGALKAHAWLRSDGRFVTGGREQPLFTEISRFEG